MFRCSTYIVFHLRQFCRFLLCFARFDTLNSIVCRVQPIKYILIKFWLIDFIFNWLRLNYVYWLGYLNYHAHIVYEITIFKIAAEFWRISHCLASFIRLNSIVCRVQTIRYTMTKFSLIDSDINWLFFKLGHWWDYLDYFVLIWRMNRCCQNHR